MVAAVLKSHKYREPPIQLRKCTEVTLFLNEPSANTVFISAKI